MSLKILGKATDFRTKSQIIYAQIQVNDYLLLIGDEFDSYGIQRKRERHKAYTRMQADIMKGALLPPITLAINQNKVSEFIDVLSNGTDNDLLDKLNESGNYSILDGLQRTYILSELKERNTEFHENQTLLLEFWVQPDIKHLIYRLIVLNAGQKPMSMRHQLELLFMSLDDLLSKEIPGIELFKEAENKRRTRAKQFQFDRIVSAYQSFLLKSAEQKKDNLVAQKLVEDSVLDSDEDVLNQSFSDFIHYLRHYVKIDELYYQTMSVNEEDGPSSHWLASENVMSSFFSAISDFSIDSKRVSRIETALNNLKENIGNSKDPLGISVFASIVKGFETSKVNVGVATRKLLTNGFKEFFREEGDKPLSECWKTEAN